MKILFGRASCSACQQRKKELLAKKISFKYMDIDTVDGLAELCYRNLYHDNMLLPIESDDDLIHFKFKEDLDNERNKTAKIPEKEKK